MEQTVPTSIPSSPALRLLCIPELVHSISKHLRRADLARLARTCHPAFRSVCPTIWQHVDGAGNLLALVKSASLHYASNNLNALEILLGRKAQIPLLKEVVLNEESDSSQFERFDYYAPFVQSLKVYPEDRRFFYVSGWQLLATHAHNRPLLPNLKKLSIAAEDSRVRRADIPLWIKLLGNQNLTDISWCIDRYVWPDRIWAFTQAATRTILGHLADSSPNIQKLCLGPRHPKENDDYYYWVLGESPPPEHWHERLHELPHLRHVSLTHGWISRSSIVALGNLPALESLELYVDSFDSYTYARTLNEECSIAAFPVLHHLSLRRLSPNNHNDIFEFRRLFERITELEVHLMDEECDDGFVAEDEEPLEWSIFSLLSNTPHLKSLLVTYLNEGAQTAPLGDQESLGIMAQLSLESISVAGVSLGKAPFPFDLGVIWSAVTELILPRQAASLQELAYFAAMPLLTRLVVQLDLTTTSTPANIPTANHAGLTALESARGGKFNPAPEMVEHHVRILNLLWPQLCEVKWAYHYQAYPPEALILNQILSLKATAVSSGSGDLSDERSSLVALYDKLREYWQRESSLREENEGSGCEFIPDNGHE